MLVGIGKPVVMLFLKFVWRRAWRRIATLRELLDEMVPFRIRAELLKGRALGIVNNVDDWVS
jgi:hypothetical protein